MITILNRYRIAKRKLLFYLIFSFLAMCVFNISFVGGQVAEDFPWVIYYPAFIRGPIDNDKDGFTKKQGDCNDSDASIYPDATEICGDGIDQNCTGDDQQCIPVNTYASESFNSGPGGFVEFTGISAINGRLRMIGDGTDYTQVTYWDGGSNPSHNWYPQPGHSNYFDNFYVSADTYWDSGAIDYIYGLAICLRRDSLGYDEWIRYAVTKDGFYIVGKIENGTYHQIIRWTRSNLLSIDGQKNELAVQKQADNFRFFINGHEVENLTIEGFQGGAVGVEASEHVNASFDDYKVTNPYQGQIVIPSEGYVLKRNELIYKTMTTTYLWHDRVPSINYHEYESAELLIKDLRYNDLDRWSYITTEEEYQKFFEEGSYIGLGFGMRRVTNDEYAISYVYNDSPSDLAGITRGDKLLAVNGRTIAEIENKNLWDSIFGKDEVGEAVRLKIRKLTGDIRDSILEKAWVNINAVLHYEIIEQDNVKIGYLVFNKFIETAENELTNVFSSFKQAGIQELILDLRYNTGGRIRLANYLASLISGSLVDGQIFIQNVHNDNYRVWDSEYRFDEPQQALDLNRVAIITSDETCSASEAVINGLKPFIDIVTIGDTTCGKPVGMYGYKIFDLHISPIEFQAQNALAEGDYFDGISPVCYADDGLTKPFGHTEEDSLFEALFYLQNGKCSIDPMSSLAIKRIERIMDKAKPFVLHGLKREIGAF